MGFRDGFDQAQAIRLPWRSLLAVQEDSGSTNRFSLSILEIE